MLTCKDFLSELTDYLDASDAMDLALRHKLEAHLTECPNCWVVCDTTKKTIKVYKGMQPQSISEDMRERLMRALERKMAAKRSAEGSTQA